MCSWPQSCVSFLADGTMRSRARRYSAPYAENEREAFREVVYANALQSMQVCYPEILSLGARVAEVSESTELIPRRLFSRDSRSPLSSSHPNSSQSQFSSLNTPLKKRSNRIQDGCSHEFEKQSHSCGTIERRKKWWR